MPDARFLQIHSLHGYSAVLLNRDDSGLAKRINYGGKNRTRISSQCLKRHWRVTKSDFALQHIDGAEASVRSRNIVTRQVEQRLRDAGHPEDVAKAVSDGFQVAVYGDKGAERSSRQPLLLGGPEIAYLASEALKIAHDHGADVKAAGKAAAAWAKASKANMKAMRESCKLPGGIAAALFGRMVTADPEANIDAAVHVAHSFTAHAEEGESDYFTVVDDLASLDEDPGPGADHIGETELTCGLFYGYVVLDRGILLSNLGNDAEMAGEVARRLVQLIATVSPGAKLGPTAPYGYASWLLVEAGDKQPRSLAEAFRTPCQPESSAAVQQINDHLKRFDATYETGEARRFMSVYDEDTAGAKRTATLDALASWAGAAMKEGSA